MCGRRSGVSVFLIADLAVVVIIILVPSLVLFLPGSLK
jgi:hypothetical protein